MTDTRESEAAWYPQRVAVIGGGRWACVVAEKLCTIVPDSVGISVHSRHGSRAAADWLTARGLQQRVIVSPGWPTSSGSPSAVIVANAARDHERAVNWALDSGYAALVEKPVALTARAAQRLAARARDRSVRLGAAHVFLFARYLERLAAQVSGKGEIRSVRVCWSDPGVETRHGAVKRFDRGLPIFADWLPHVASIVGLLLPGGHCSCRSLGFLRGGAHLELQLAVDGVPCEVQLIRNGERRQRLIEVAASDGILRLDFSVEPGTISCGSTTENADPDWNTRETPLALMLRAFLRWAGTGQFDARLDIETGLRACRLIDQTFLMYNAALLPWLAGGLARAADSDEDLRYALEEILQWRGPLATVALEREIRRVRNRFVEVADIGWLTSLANARNLSAEEQS